MGGFGSGRHWHYGRKNTTADYRLLNVQRLQRDGLLIPGKIFGWNWMRDGQKVAFINVQAEIERVILNYRHRSGEGEWKSEEYPVRLEWTPCTYGGRRAWFLCPASGCGRRVAHLYGGGIFACRHCYKLAYSSQRESNGDRAARRAGKIRKQLGWEPGILNNNGAKPKGMRWQTYQRLAVVHDALINISLRWMQQRMQKIEDKFGDIGVI